MYEIEKNIPPKKMTFKAFLDTLEIGDSFVCPKYKAYSVYSNGRSLGKKFKISEISPDECRIWRVPMM